MDTEQKNVALDDETLETVNGAGLKEALGRIAESTMSDYRKGADIGSYGGDLGRGIGGYVGANIGLMKGIKNEIF
ncbi:hypothetical protein [Bradyrhizobium sp. Leo121]|uniref:hypothetical protein n=1 Tax=Bradyrhizobium sp. Leo121 TaxID=1571195 RepID=UPI00102A44BA|nr:hypothetical protein [Bradyrhizobium sp. Leo121]RZN19595.1 hypothetical protein CWO90_35130 [Bradyrhizobium sp. Leo121]